MSNTRNDSKWITPEKEKKKLLLTILTSLFYDFILKLMVFINFIISENGISFFLIEIKKFRIVNLYFQF